MFHVEVENENWKVILLNLVYRPPNGDQKEFQNYFKNTFLKRDCSSKDIIIVGYFKINVLDFIENKKVQSFMNLMFRYGIFLTIIKTNPYY